MSKFYGASYNCYVGYDHAIGGAEFNESDVEPNTIDFVSGSISALENRIVNDCVADEGWEADEFFSDRSLSKLIGQEADVGGNVVSVIYYMESDNVSYVVAAIFEAPNMPEVV